MCMAMGKIENAGMENAGMVQNNFILLNLCPMLPRCRMEAVLCVLHTKLIHVIIVGVSPFPCVFFCDLTTMNCGSVR